MTFLFLVIEVLLLLLPNDVHVFTNEINGFRIVGLCIRGTVYDWKYVIQRHI